MTHISVLLKEVIEGLEINKDDIVVDATVGSGGHSKAIADLLGKEGIFIGIDMDKKALSIVKKKLYDLKCKIVLKEGNFKNIDKFLKEEEIESIDKILFDFGMSSEQLENSGRGFSFLKDEPLIMTFKENWAEEDLTAREIVNNWDEENIADIIFGYGEEKFAKKIAEGIAKYRKEKQIESTFKLVSIIKNATPKWYHFKKIHFATKTFQALRITVNDEIQSIKDALKKSFNLLNKGGRIATISFHSTEDRIVKQQFKLWKNAGEGILIIKKPITPTLEEIKQNPRSRSSKLRILEKI